MTARMRRTGRMAMAEAAYPALALARLPLAERRAMLDALSPAQLQALLHDFGCWGRPEQQPPAGDWRVWAVVAGRGFGKTRAGAEWVRALAEAQPWLRVALVGATLAEARAVMVEGEAGLLNIAAPAQRPHFEPSLRRLSWRNGARAFLYSAEEPEQLRGPEHHVAWCDELAKWPDAETVWMNLQMGLRLGTLPRAVVTTTPRPVPLLRQLLDDPAVARTRGRTADNRAFLAPGFLEAVTAAYAGTRLGRQELDGELVEDIAGALWSRAGLDRGRVRAAPPLVRVVVAVDPPVSSGPGADACGIVAAGRDAEGHGYVLADHTLAGASPEAWARAAVAAADHHGADRLVAEVNNGGELVGVVLRSVDARVPLKLVRASRGKAARAEPVAALYERGLVHHVGGLADLEDQLCGLLSGGGYEGPGRSPDRADAAVWALTELMLARAPQPRVRRV